MSNTLTKKGELARQKIFMASIKLFEINGYTKTSIKSICEEAGIGIGTFYHYFSSKKDILINLVKDEEESLLKEAALFKDELYYDKIIKTLKLQYNCLEYKNKEFLAYFTSFSITEPGKENVINNYVTKNLILGFLKKGEAKKEFTCFNSPEFVRDTIIHILLGHIILWSSTRNDKEIVRLEDLENQLIITLNLLLKR